MQPEFFVGQLRMLRALPPSRYRALSEAIHTCAFVRSFEDLKVWWAEYFQQLIPHAGLLCYRAEHDGFGALISTPIALGDYPIRYLETIRKENRRIHSPLLDEWWESCRPVLFDPARDSRAADDWFDAFTAYDLQKVAVHGVIGPDLRTRSCFSLVRIDCEMSAQMKDFLGMLAPLLHQSFIRALTQQSAPSCFGAAVPGILTRRELEIIAYLASGMTIPEIAAKVHRSTHTIKNHARNILSKLGCANRAEAVSRAIKLGLLT
jgi:DNA-binding CsgD family transcriptional regulator